MTPEQSHIYSRHLMLNEIGSAGQQKLIDACVAIVGLGGLGCPVSRYLAAAGVGRLILIDGDFVDETNLHRQTLYGKKDVGLLKAETAKRILSEQFPNQDFTIHANYLSTSNANEILSEATIVVDCTDNFQARYLINDACVQLNKSFVYGALHKFEGQVAVFNHVNGPTYRCLFPKAPKAGNLPNCSELGVLGVLPGIIGTMQALEAIKCIVGTEGILDREMITYHALRNEILKVKMPARNEEVYQSIKQNPIELIVISDCDIEHEITWKELIHSKKYAQIIDLRELHELPEGPEFTTHRIPISRLSDLINELDATLPTALYCQSGKRSLNMVRELSEKYQFLNVVSIQGGVQVLKEETKTYEKLL